MFGVWKSSCLVCLEEVAWHVEKPKRRFVVSCQSKNLSNEESTKCDQLTPTCSRCKRLQLACIGPGAQRYKFLEQRFENESEEIQSPEQENSSVALIRRPSNPLLLMTSSFIEKLEVTDLRYDLTWTYGGFLKHIPKRLGTNEALDSAVGAVTGAFPTLYTGQISRGALTSYGDGLKALRVCLDDPSKAQTAETLCAIYLMIICQVSFSPNCDRVAHWLIF